MEENRADRIAEIEEKEKRIRLWMSEAGYAGVLLRQQRNFFWATAGAGNPVVYAVDAGFQSVLFTADNRYVLSQQVEMPRLQAEETGDLGFEHVQFNWWEEDIQKLASGIVSGRIACDIDLAGTENADAEIADMRPNLTGWEVQRFRRLSAEAAECVEQTCRELEPGMTEFEIAALLLGKTYRYGIRAPVLLVGADERALSYRHPVPTGKQLRNYVMIVLCAERSGLVAPLTRFSHFGPLPGDLEKRYDALRQVAARLLLSSQPGRTIGSAMQEAMAAYAENGYPDEWQRHYQGGICGYAAREVGGTPDGTFLFHPNQVLGWNPTITGTKIEDSVLLKQDGLENLTLTASWPSREEKVKQGSHLLPDILVR